MNYSANWKDLVSSFGYGFADDLDQIKHIVRVWAYTDMQPRTISGLGTFRQNKNNNDKVEMLFDKLAEELYSFVCKDTPKTDQDEFDAWHKKICDYFIGEFNGITSNSKVDKIAFGKAQKIVNVSFKYIYCLKDVEKYAEKFKYCHMILDRYTYSEGFYKHEVIPWFNSVNPKSKVKQSGLTSWSNLHYDEYQIIQCRIRDFLKDKANPYINDKGIALTPFQAEFYIFDRYNR